MSQFSMGTLGCKWGPKTRDARALQAPAFKGAVLGSQSATAVLETAVFAMRRENGGDLSAESRKRFVLLDWIWIVWCGSLTTMPRQ